LELVTSGKVTFGEVPKIFQALPRQTDRQIDTTIALIYKMYRQIHTHLCIRNGVHTSTFVPANFFLGEMSDFPGVASYTWKNNLAWLAKVSLRGEPAIWINYSSSNVARKHNLQ